MAQLDILKGFFTVTAFGLSVHVLEKSGRKRFSFKHVSMGLDIFIIVVFQVFVVFNRPHLPPPLIPSVNINIWK